MSREPRLLFSWLRCFYAWAIPLSWPLTRIAAGLILAIHGWGKIERGMSAQTAQLAKTMLSLQAFGEPFSMFLTFIELGGGVCSLAFCRRQCH